jgi:hypothetical protein
MHFSPNIHVLVCVPFTLGVRLVDLFPDRLLPRVSVVSKVPF